MTYRSASSRAAAFDQALREAMSTPVPDRITTEPPARTAITAGADIPESYYPYRVAPVPPVIDSDSDSADRDGVEHIRKARLRRWQAVEPRERRT